MTKIIPLETFGLVDDAMQLVAMQRDRAANMENECKSAFDAARLEGFETGRREGLELIGAHLGDALGRAERDLLEFEDRISAVVFQAIGMILGEIEPEERYRQIVNQALKSVAGSSEVLVKVSDADEGIVSQALSNGHPNIRVVSDKYMAAGEIVLETGGLRSQIGLVDQLAKLMEAINRG